MEHIAASQVHDRLTMPRAIDALQEAIEARGFGDTPQRLHLGDGKQDLLVMPAMDAGWAGTKFVSLDRDNPGRGLPFVQGVYTLLGPPGLQPLATIDAPALTAIRTAAVSGLATRLLAREDATRVVVLGTGVQARSHVQAMAAVRDLEEVVIVGRRPEAVAAFAEEIAVGYDLAVRAGTPDDVAVADLICACTSSRTPVFRGTALPRGVHINAVGSFRPDVQELDTTSVTTSRVVVEVRSAALSEKGDLVAARDRAGWDPDTIVADLAELVRGEQVGRRTPDDRTLFASVGHAFEDLIIARAMVG
jgi:ornithine cyclodeaminase/alanine dehydrogenase-like protein (mu-crystallin family)